MNLCVCEQQWVLNIYSADTFCSLIRDYHQVSSAETALEREIRDLFTAPPPSGGLANRTVREIVKSINIRPPDLNI